MITKILTILGLIGGNIVIVIMLVIILVLLSEWIKRIFKREKHEE